MINPLPFRAMLVGVGEDETSPALVLVNVSGSMTTSFETQTPFIGDRDVLTCSQTLLAPEFTTSWVRV